MKIVDAISLMAKNPAVDFPWEGIVVDLVNSFLPAESQLDPSTAEVTDVQSAIDRLDTSTKQMLMNTHLAAPAFSIPTTGDQPTKDGKMARRNSIVFMAFGVVICVCALLVAVNVGNGAEGDHLIKILEIMSKIMMVLLDTPE